MVFHPLRHHCSIRSSFQAHYFSSAPLSLDQQNLGRLWPQYSAWSESVGDFLGQLSAAVCGLLQGSLVVSAFLDLALGSLSFLENCDGVFSLKSFNYAMSISTWSSSLKALGQQLQFFFVYLPLYDRHTGVSMVGGVGSANWNAVSWHSRVCYNMYHWCAPTTFHQASSSVLPHGDWSSLTPAHNTPCTSLVLLLASYGCSSLPYPFQTQILWEPELLPVHCGPVWIWSPGPCYHPSVSLWDLAFIWDLYSWISPWMCRSVKAWSGGCKGHFWGRWSHRQRF